MKHLITGAGGFLGTHLGAYLLKKNPSDTVVSVGIRGPANPQISHEECDLLDLPRLTQIVAKVSPDRVYHLAGSARVSQDIGMPEYTRANFETTRNLLASLEGISHPFRLFFSSSVHVYGNQTTEVDESSDLTPNGYYGMSKYLCERAVEEFTKAHPQTRVVVGRLYSCIGPGQGPGFVTSDLTLKLMKLSNGGKLETGPLNAHRRFLDVRDAAEIISRLLENSESPTYDTVNIASPFEMQVKDVVEMLVAASGKKVAIHSKAADGNPFKGLQLSTRKLDKRVPGFAYRPVEKTVKDLWAWAIENA